jgi:hypothetical protein
VIHRSPIKQILKKRIPLPFPNGNDTSYTSIIQLKFSPLTAGDNSFTWSTGICSAHALLKVQVSKKSGYISSYSSKTFLHVRILLKNQAKPDAICPEWHTKEMVFNK